MKYIYILVVFATSLFSSEYYSKIEALNSYVIKAAVSGKILYTNDKIEGKRANNSLIIQLDDKLDLVELKQTKKKLVYINEMISIEKNNYKRLKNISSKSIFEKESQKLKFINLESSQSDLLFKIASLNDKIKNKKLVEKDTYIYALKVKQGDYVNPGTILYESKDLSAGKMEIYIPINDAKMLQEKTIYLDNQKTSLKIDKIFEVADEKHISSYKVQIIIPNVKTFSRLAKLEFK